MEIEEEEEEKEKEKKDVSRLTDAKASHDEERLGEHSQRNRGVHSSAARERLSFSWHLRAE